jgi:NADH-quinone oxidoreductase subunit K
MPVPLSAYLILSAFLFATGVVGVAIRRNALIIFMSIELMLNAVNLTFLAFARFLNSMDGQIFVFFVMVVAAAEVAVGLAIIITLYRNRNTLNPDDAADMKW